MMDWNNIQREFDRVNAMSCKPVGMQKYKAGHIFDENMSVKWNRDKLAEENKKFQDEVARLNTLKNKGLLAVHELVYQKIQEDIGHDLPRAAAEKILKNGGVVFGAAYNADLFVEHICIEDINGLYKLKGSKYVESTTNSTYSKVLSYLKNGKKVLYSGTPCQIAGLKKFLGKDYENLFTMDLICHGVPSERLFHKYLEWQSGQLGGKIIYCGFRDKDVGGCSCNGSCSHGYGRSFSALSRP